MIYSRPTAVADLKSSRLRMQPSQCVFGWPQIVLHAQRSVILDDSSLHLSRFLQGHSQTIMCIRKVGIDSHRFLEMRGCLQCPTQIYQRDFDVVP